MTWETALSIGFYIFYFLLMIMKHIQDNFFQSQLKVKKIKVKVKLHLLLSTDDNEAYSGYTSLISAEGQEDQNESKTTSSTFY